MTINRLTDERVMQHLCQFEGAYEEAASMGDDEFAAECADVACILREVQERRSADKNCLLYGIVDCNGNAYIDECCVALVASQLDSVIDELNTEYEDGEYANDGAPYRVAALYTALPLTDSERAELQEYRKAETADREMLKRLSVILSGSDAPGEIKALTVTAQSFVDRCKLLSKERDALRNTVGNGHEPSDR